MVKPRTALVSSYFGHRVLQAAWHLGLSKLSSAWNKYCLFSGSHVSTKGRIKERAPLLLERHGLAEGKKPLWCQGLSFCDTPYLLFTLPRSCIAAARQVEIILDPNSTQQSAGWGSEVDIALDPSSAQQVAACECKVQ
eukprot:s585_g18.t1